MELHRLSLSQLARLCAFLEGRPRATVGDLARGQRRAARALARRGVGLDAALREAGIRVFEPGPLSGRDLIEPVSLDELFA